MLRRRQSGGVPSPRSMTQQPLQAFIAAIRQDPALQAQLSTAAAADADDVAAIARAAGFEVRVNDLVSYADGALVEYDDEDWFLRPTWWELAD